MSPLDVRTGLHWILAAYAVIYSDKVSASKDSKGAKEGRWMPVGKNVLTEIKHVIITYGLYSTCVKEMIRTWASNVRAISHDFSPLASAILEDGPTLMFGIYFREESKHIKEQERAKGVEVSQDQILGIGTYVDPQVQALYDKEVLSLCHKAALNAWDRIPELG